jgi:hypothetical protein
MSIRLVLLRSYRNNRHVLMLFRWHIVVIFDLGGLSVRHAQDGAGGSPISQTVSGHMADVTVGSEIEKDERVTAPARRTCAAGIIVVRALFRYYTPLATIERIVRTDRQVDRPDDAYTDG